MLYSRTRLLILFVVLSLLPLTFASAQKASRTRYLNWFTNVTVIPQGDAYKITISFKTNDPIYYGIGKVTMALYKDERLTEKAGLGEYFTFHIARSKLLKDHQETPRGAENEEEEKWYGTLTDQGELFLVAVPQMKIESYTKLKQLSCMKCDDPECGEKRWFYWWPQTFATHQRAQDFLERLMKRERKDEQFYEMDCESLRKHSCF